jgi:acyl-ACP thioesterase
VHDLGARGQTWVLARLLLRLDRPVSWGESVRVATWPAGTHRLFALRDFRLVDANGGAIGTATSGWVLMHLATRRPVRPPAEIEALEARAPGRALVDGMDKLLAPEAPWREQAIEVRHGDLDVNGHANNVAVIGWALEALADEELARVPVELAVEFRAEAVRGDVIASRASSPGNESATFAHALVRSRDGRELARVRTVWS